MPSLGKYRWEALVRATFGLVWLALVYLVGIVLGLVALAFFVVDVLWQFITNREGLRLGGYIQRTWDWSIANTEYVIFGRGGIEWMP